MGQGASRRYVSWAAQEGRVEDLIYHLKETGPDGVLPAPNSKKNRSPLHLAAMEGRSQCISVLYDAGAKLNRTDADGMTALHYAAAGGHLYAVQLLIELGADVEKQSRFGVRPIHLATSCGHTPMIQVLINNGACVNVQESWGQTPLMIATQSSRLQCMQLLLDYGADREERDHYHGNTALHIAIATKDEETLLVLLDAGCSVHNVNGNSLSCLGTAIENKFYQAVPLLLDYGARPNEADWAVISPGLQSYVINQLASPISLMRQCRVAVRKCLSPSQLEQLTKEGHPLAGYIHSIREECCSGGEVKRHALRGTTWFTDSKKATTKV